MNDREENRDLPDPIGLGALERAVSFVIRLGDEDDPGPRWRAALSALGDAAAAVSERYDLLCDRYAQLKLLGSRLSEELCWLRDQVDDLAADSAPEPPGSSETETSSGKGGRRYSDRWSR
ncbi:MAG: hypothetical protein R6V85_17945 [Polyangia bacterium]